MVDFTNLNKTAIHCKTRDEATAFLKECDRQGITWYGGEKATKLDFYSDYKEKTCYHPHCKFISFSGLDYFIENGYKILEFANQPASTLTIPYTGSKAEAHKRLEAEIAKLGGVREVKRAAKVGEYIKLTTCNKFYESCGLTAGGVYLVHRVDSDGDAWVIPNIQNVCVGKGEGCNSSYVVLENYIPAEPAKPKGAKATPERIENARRFAKLLLTECFDREISVVFYVSESGKNVKADLSYGVPYKNKSATAKCTPEDEYNVWIGRAVALCKAVGRELPDWLVGKSE